MPLDMQQPDHDADSASRPSKLSERLLILHPLLWTALPILYLYAHNVAQLLPIALLWPLLISLGVTCMLWMILFLCTRDRHTAAVQTTFAVIGIFTYGHVYNVTAYIEVLVPGWRQGYFVAWCLIVVAGLVLISRRRNRLHRMSEALSVTALILVTLFTLPILRTELTRARMQALKQQAMRRQAASTAALPDIYYIILDSYAGEDTLRRLYHYDNRPFLYALEQRGFFVSRGSRSNYSQTILSLASSLNSRYLGDLAITPGHSSNDRYAAQQLIQQNQVCETLQAHGYRVVAFPTSYAPAQVASDISVEQLQGFSDFEMATLNTTPLLGLTRTTAGTRYDPYAVHRQRICWLFDHTPDAVRFKGPLFVFVHILAPHQPLVFDEQGRPLRADLQASKSLDHRFAHEIAYKADYTRKYRGELIYLNRRILEMVDSIRENTTRPTVIILQGDHGPGFTPDHEAELSVVDIPERFSILYAISVPGGTPPAMYHGISPVNTFRVLFNHLLGTQAPLLPDRAYLSPILRPYRLRDVTAQANRSR